MDTLEVVRNFKPSIKHITLSCTFYYLSLISDIVNYIFFGCLLYEYINITLVYVYIFQIRYISNTIFYYNFVYLKPPIRYCNKKIVSDDMTRCAPSKSALAWDIIMIIDYPMTTPIPVTLTAPSFQRLLNPFYPFTCSHWCQQTNATTEKQFLCGYNQQLSASTLWVLDIEKSGLTDLETAGTLNSQLDQWAQDPANSPPCVFTM